MSDLSHARVIEIVKFKIKSGVSFGQFASLDRAVELQHVSQQPGFVARQAAKGENGEWLVVVYWTNEGHADASMASFTDAPAAAEFMAHLDVDTMSLTRYTMA